MGVYSIGRNYSRDFDNAGIIECQYEPGMEAALNIVAESELNFNKLMQAVAKDELGYLQENGVEMVYEAGAASSFIEKIKAFFLKIWEKIKGLFRKFFAKIDSFIKEDKSFVSKYKDRIINADVKDFKFKGFKFTNLDKLKSNDVFDAAGDVYTKSFGQEFRNLKLDPSIDITNIAKDIVNGGKDTFKKEVENFNDNEQDLLEDARGAVLGASSYTSTEFNEELFKYFRDDESSKQEKELSDLDLTKSDLLTIITTASKNQKDAEDDYKELDKEIKKVIKGLESLEKKLLNATPDKKGDSNKSEIYSIAVQLTNISTRATKNCLAIAQVVNGAKLTALKDRNRQAKAICVALVGRKSIKESYDDYSYNEGASFLSELNFI